MWRETETETERKNLKPTFTARLCELEYRLKGCNKDQNYSE